MFTQSFPVGIILAAFLLASITSRVQAQTVLPAPAAENASSSSALPVATGTTPPQTPRTSPARPAFSSTDDEIVEMSVFTVQAQDDYGYQAANTTSGSRLKTSLKDTAASISPFTAEFLSDIGATNLEEMLAYAGNVEMDVEDAKAGFNFPDGRFAATTNSPFRMRGMNASATRDYVDSAVPMDFYNAERVEAASGPNSILFGLGNAGGTIVATTKRAQFNRSRTGITNLLGSWNYERLTLDQNHVLIRGKLGLRLNALYQNSDHWRYWQFNNQKRINPALVIKPFRATAIHLNYERGKMDNSTVVPWNLQDQVTAWLDAGRPLATGADTAGIGSYNTANRYVFVDNNGAIYNARGEYKAVGLHASDTSLCPPEISPYEYSSVGPGGQRHQTFESWSAIIEQRAGPVNIEFGYFHNNNDVTALSPNSGGQPTLTADPNATIPLIGSTNQTAPNPNVGKLYVDMPWFSDEVSISNDIVRLTAAHTLKLGKWWGRHNIAALLEHSVNERTRHWKSEIYVDDSNAAINNTATPEGDQNQVFRRHYVTEGDYKTYYAGDGRIPAAGFNIGDKHYHSTFVSRDKANDHTRQSIDSCMIALQSYWLDSRLVTTLGWRTDRITLRDELESRLADPADPRILSGRATLNEWVLDGSWQTQKYKPESHSLGGVFHFTRRLSGFYNTSTNRGTPRFDRKVLPDGGLPPPSSGKSQDCGIMVDFLGNDRCFLRLTRYDTEEMNDSSIVPNSAATNSSALLGSTNLTRIYAALLDAGKITQAQYDAQLVTYNAGMSDVTNKGYEAEFIANPTRSITIRATYSYSDRERTNLFAEIHSYYARMAPQWFAAAAGDQALTDTIYKELNSAANENPNNENGVYKKLDNQSLTQRGGRGSRPHKFNITARYRLPDKGMFRGLAIGGGARYQGANIMGYDEDTGDAQWGEAMYFFDTFLTCRRRIFHNKATLVLQLNVRNVTNNDLVVLGRANAAKTASFRVYLNEPRNIRLTATINF